MSKEITQKMLDTMSKDELKSLTNEQLKSLEGLKMGSYTLIKFLPSHIENVKTGASKKVFLCECECGKRNFVRWSNLNERTCLECRSCSRKRTKGRNKATFVQSDSHDATSYIDDFLKALEDVKPTATWLIHLPFNEAMYAEIDNLSKKYGVTHQHLTLGLIKSAIKSLREV